ncbi:pilus assembly protein [Pseudarthrobacter sp. BRE9]|uniref:TadE/TadG family type IV pilus assembly protein n=1 Tax=Pseudarthrobacter sp. BRE9 TaxID=2962582 RepID=UPI002882160D|nr:pilus assembly protein [Pseudarthrobacter sp. BRE9]MDT0167850.1 pilus assembly protein [Pseudarthrobacter sp. BRE9]
MSQAAERGAAAVEFAIVVPVLVALLLGIMEFSRAYNAQASLSAAAREAVRVMATSDRTPAAVATAKANAITTAKTTAVSLQPGLPDSAIQFGTACPSTIPSGTNPQTTVTITYSLSTLTGIAGPFTMTAKGAMLCGG